MGDLPQNHNQTLEPQQATAKAAILAECDKLMAAGVTFVAVHFDGYGDRRNDRRSEVLRQRMVCG
jgi:hypothetical protein